MADSTCTECIAEGNAEARAVFARGLCRRHYSRALAARKAAGEVIRRGPDRTTSIDVGCHRCGATVRVSGKRRQAAEQGRPVYCSHGCQKVSTKVTLPCTGCGTPVERYRSQLTSSPEGRQVRVFCAQCRKAGGAPTKPRRGTTGPCAVCGDDVYRGPSHDPAKPRYCSGECYGVSLQGERVERVERECEVCGTTMRLSLDQMRADVRTCSRECTAINRRAKPGERKIDDHGYAWITAPDGRRMMEHRFVMEEHIGRALLATETVHHKTGGLAGRSDNRIENLELWTGRHPKGHRVEDVVEYAREMLAMYGTAEEQGRYIDLRRAVSDDPGAADDGVPVPE